MTEHVVKPKIDEYRCHLMAGSALPAGACKGGPVMRAQPDGVCYHVVTPTHMDRITEQHLVGGQPVEEMVFHRGTGHVD